MEQVSPFTNTVPPSLTKLAVHVEEGTSVTLWIEVLGSKVARG